MSKVCSLLSLNIPMKNTERKYDIKVAQAAPLIPYIGINHKFNKTLVIIPKTDL